MPIIIEGYLVVSTKKLREHPDHDLSVALLAVDDKTSRVSLWCRSCTATIEKEPDPQPESLPCGCPDMEMHDEGIALQTKFRKDFRIPKSTCVGCYLGDDGPSLHSCYVHLPKYWPTAS